jgi:hypothetical protein
MAAGRAARGYSPAPHRITAIEQVHEKAAGRAGIELDRHAVITECPGDGARTLRPTIRPLIACAISDRVNMAHSPRSGIVSGSLRAQYPIVSSRNTFAALIAKPPFFFFEIKHAVTVCAAADDPDIGVGKQLVDLPDVRADGDAGGLVVAPKNASSDLAPAEMRTAADEVEDPQLDVGQCDAYAQLG